MATIPQAVRNVKNYFAAYVPETVIHDACADADHQWRERQLGPVITTWLFLQQILQAIPPVAICVTCRAKRSTRRRIVRRGHACP